MNKTHERCHFFRKIRITPSCSKTFILGEGNPRGGVPVVPTESFPKMKFRWTATGDTIDTLTLSPSVDLSKIPPEDPASPERCYWHGFVQNGEAK